MELFRIAYGPWERLFTGNFQEHELEIYSNPDKMLLIVIYEKVLDRIEGTIVELYKVFSAEGEVEQFTETLPREALVLTKHDENSTMRFLLLGSKPAYVHWAEEEFIKEVDSQVKRLTTSASMIKDVSKAYELTLKEISESDEDVQSAFFSQPMLVPLLATSSHGTSAAPRTELKALTKGEVMLGITRDSKRVAEPLALFTKAIVTDGTADDRQAVMQVVAESALLSNVPAIIFDFDNRFSGMGEATKQVEALQKFQVSMDPIGFPIKSFVPGRGIKADINFIMPEELAEAFGIGDKDFPRILRALVQHTPVNSFSDVFERASKFSQTEEFSEFKIGRVARIAKVIDLRYSDLFGGKNDVSELAKEGTSNIARASLLNLSGLDARAKALVLISTLREINASFKLNARPNSIKAMVFVPSIEAAQHKEKMPQISKGIVQSLKELPQNGGAYCLAAEHLIDIEQDIRNDATAKLSIVLENDVSVQLGNMKTYRVLVRGTLSTLHATKLVEPEKRAPRKPFWKQAAK